MKKVVLALTFAFSLHAQAVTVEEFTADFVEQTNHRLKFVNKERSAKNKQIYCSELSDEQISTIKNLASTPHITVTQFMDALSQELKCYPMFWAPWGKQNLGGLVFNSKASMMDLLLVNDVLIDLNEGQVPNSDELLLNFYSHFPF
ncbi:hypothetical protein [Bdellovibrio reynosensis]|uniref:Uncharacterized protein n=1 Tax=Bdellovibrio reynosensis TaxID=2835041 RepID=A0ABY4CFU0_9BACT|nr:hypothetical protein [Bdellovibrio reynosensis]UOF02651.1 hypothetical protein MNR06_06770 [Bdellovibrio reynosensis]